MLRQTLATITSRGDRALTAPPRSRLADRGGRAHNRASDRGRHPPENVFARLPAPECSPCGAESIASRQFSIGSGWALSANSQGVLTRRLSSMVNAVIPPT